MEPTNQPAPQPQPQIQTQPQVQQPVPPQQAKATVPQPATVGLLGPNLQEHDRTLRLWRLYVRIAAASFVALSMILFIAQGAQTSNIYTSSCSYYNSRYCRSYSIQTYDLVSLPILAVAMIWNIAEFITYCVNKRGAHPGVHVGLDLVAWLILLFAGIIAVAGYVVLGLTPLGIAAGALEIIACVLHFTLFVMACVATHRRRMFMKSHVRDLHSRLVAPQVVYAYPPPPPPGMSYMTPGHYGPQYHELEQRGGVQAQSNVSPPSAVSPTISSSTPSTQPAVPYNNGGERYA